jgi:predicted nucleic acid-binding protein
VILLDTNVLSVLMQRQPEPRVVSWLDGQPAESLWTSAVTVFEIRFGLEILATGVRRRKLEEAFAALLAEDFDNRVVDFDQSAAEAAAAIAAAQRRIGRAIDIRDVQIAGIASARKATLATRNIRHFEGLDVPLIDPWSV